jgi:hypothetical protein
MDYIEKILDLEKEIEGEELKDELKFLKNFVNKYERRIRMFGFEPHIFKYKKGDVIINDTISYIDLAKKGIVIELKEPCTIIGMFECYDENEIAVIRGEKICVGTIKNNDNNIIYVLLKHENNKVYYNFNGIEEIGQLGNGRIGFHY